MGRRGVVKTGERKQKRRDDQREVTGRPQVELREDDARDQETTKERGCGF